MFYYNYNIRLRIVNTYLKIFLRALFPAQSRAGQGTAWDFACADGTFLPAEFPPPRIAPAFSGMPGDPFFIRFRGLPVGKEKGPQEEDAVLAADTVLKCLTDGPDHGKG